MSPPTSNGLPPYPAYKDSGVEWLERVPAHWEVRRLGQIGVFFKCSGGTKADDVPAGVPCIRYGHLYTQFDHFIERGVSFLSPENVERYSSVECGDVLFAGSGESVDEIGKSAALLLEDGAYAGGDIIAFRSAPGLLTPRFAGYVCECPSSTSQKSAMSRGITIEHIYGHQLKRLAVPIPPLPEQAAIARFLDHADRRIWRYIRAKERLIELVEEQKQAIIHEAVTGRIDVRTGQPYPAYKDSGVEWLERVPAHWEVRRLGQIGVFLKCSGGTKADDVPAGVPCIRYGHLYTQFDHFIERGVSFLSPENVERYSSVECGDVLFAGSGESVDEIGKSAALLLEDGAYAGGDIIAFRSAWATPSGSTGGTAIRANRSSALGVAWRTSRSTRTKSTSARTSGGRRRGSCPSTGAGTRGRATRRTRTASRPNTCGATSSRGRACRTFWRTTRR